MNPAPAEARLPLRPPPRAGSGPIVARPPLHDLDEAERIASKDRSSLYRVSQFFEDPLRYHAFIAMYAVMRVIDDRIDGAGDKSRLPLADRQALHAFLDDWEHRIRCAYAGHPAHQPLDRALSWAVARFPVPLALWTSFLQAMRFDVDCPRFDTYSTFLAYAEGASVAPTTIFVYLMTASCEADGVFRVPAFDYQRCGQHLGRFAYVAHILRDLRIDMQASEGGLVYLAQADLQAHGLDESTLRAFTQTGAADPRFDRLVATLVQRARTEQAPGVTLARTIWPALPVDCHFIFQLIVRTYGELLDRIARTPNLVLSEQPILGPKEQARLAEAVAARTSYPIAKLARATRSPHAAKNRPATPASLAAARTDAAWVLGGASLATAAICCLYPYPLWISLAMAGLLAWFATRWTHPGDRLGFAVGGTLGLLTELLADEGGLWRHANTQVLGLMPAYLLFCYPLLGGAVPRLIRACLGRDRPLSEGTRATGLRALALWALLTTLCVQLADNQHLLLLACALCLGLFLWQFRSPHDRATLLLGGGLGLLWELPCTWTGAWSFPHPQWLGLIPFWLPVAYAVFFGTLGRVTATMVTQWAVRTPAPLPGLSPPVPLPNSLLAPKPEEE